MTDLRSGQEPAQSEDADPVPLSAWLRGRARAGAVANLVAFTLLAATAASRAAHGVLSPAGLVAVVVGAAVAATTTGWVAGFYEGADAGLRGQLDDLQAAFSDELAGRRVWHRAAAWAAASALWTTAGAVVVAAVLRDHSAPFPVLAIALLAIAAPAAIAVDLAARAAGSATGSALRTSAPSPEPLLRRAWRDLALPLAAVQAVVNAGAAWVLFHAHAADGTLTKADAFADATLVAALVASLFGTLGARWGAVDAASGRVTADQAPATAEAPGASGRRHPFGPQALVYAAGLAIVATSLAGLVVPASPSLLRVAVVRGVLAGTLTLVACALGVVRGASNTPPLDLSRRDLLPVPAPSSRIPVGRRLATLAGVSAVVSVLALAATPLVDAPRPAAAQAMEGLGLVAELDALAVRVEYDLPIPAGTGSAPQVVGAARRTGGGEAANGVAAAPTRFDPVVGGTVYDPDKTPGSGDENQLPQSECAYPGALTDIDFTFPADMRSEAASSPPIGWSSARCGAGPTVELHASSASPDRALALGPAVSLRGGVADATAGPVQGVLSADASARAEAVSILDGLVTVDAIVSHGVSRTDGQPGGARTEAAVDLVGVSVAGTRFDLRGGDLVVDGEHLPVGGSAASAVLRSLTAALAPSGCRIAVLDSPAAYPQGFLFGRPAPELGVADDGTLAASMTGGLLVECDLPQDLTKPTGFSPERVQVVLGFVYTGVTARADIGGFSLGDVGVGTPLGGTGGGLAFAPSAPSFAGDTSTAPVVAGAAPATPTGAGTEPAARGPLSERIQLLAANFAADRPWIWLGALALWLLLTHQGLERVRREMAGATS